MTAQASALSPRDYLRFALGHLDLFATIGDAGVALASADSFVERWDIIKPVGDELAPLADELFGASALVDDPCSDADLESQLLVALNQPSILAERPVRDGRWLKIGLELFMQLLPLLLKR